MTNPVIGRDEPLALGSPATLIYFDGTHIETRATIAPLPQSEGQLAGEFSASGFNAWVPEPAAYKNIEFLEASDRGVLRRWRVLDRELVGGPLSGSVPWSTVRLQLINEDDGTGVGNADYDPADYSSADFN